MSCRDLSQEVAYLTSYGPLWSFALGTSGQLASTRLSFAWPQPTGRSQAQCRLFMLNTAIQGASILEGVKYIDFSASQLSTCQ